MGRIPNGQSTVVELRDENGPMASAIVVEARLTAHAELDTRTTPGCAYFEVDGFKVYWEDPSGGRVEIAPLNDAQQMFWCEWIVDAAREDGYLPVPSR